MWNYIFYLPHPTSISQGLRSRKPEFNTILTVSERDPLSLQAAQYSLCFQSCPPFSEKNGQSTPKYCTPKYSWKIVWTWSLFTAAMQAILAPEPLRDISNYHIHVFTLVAVLAVWNLSPVPFYTSKTKSLHLLMLRCGNAMKPVTAAKLYVSCCQGDCIAKMCHCPLLPHPTPGCCHVPSHCQAGGWLIVPEVFGEIPSVGTWRFFHWSYWAQRLQGAEGTEGKGGWIIHKVRRRAASVDALRGNTKSDEVSTHIRCKQWASCLKLFLTPSLVRSHLLVWVVILVLAAKSTSPG